MLQTASDPKHGTGEHIKITPLYTDFRMNRSPAVRSG
jgi:hypothetical protein